MTTTEHRTPPHPDTHPATLTGAPAKIFETLTTHPGSTSAELAQSAGIGRSTAGKALAALESKGLAVREPGHHGPNHHRTPDQWHPHPETAPTATHPDNDDKQAPQPAPAAKELLSDQERADAPDIRPRASGAGAAPASEVTDAEQSPDTPTAIAQEQPENTPASTAEDVDDSNQEASALKDSPRSDTPDAADTAPQVTPIDGNSAPDTTGTAPAVSGSGRLRPGALRELVINHLRAHPNEAYTATGISRAIEKSSGAIANALVKLTKQGITQQVSETPRRYQYAAHGTRES